MLRPILNLTTLCGSPWPYDDDAFPTFAWRCLLHCWSWPCPSPSPPAPRQADPLPGDQSSQLSSSCKCSSSSLPGGASGPGPLPGDNSLSLVLVYLNTIISFPSISSGSLLTEAGYRIPFQKAFIVLINDHMMQKRKAILSRWSWLSRSPSPL